MLFNGGCLGISVGTAACIYGAIHLIAIAGIVQTLRNQDKDFKGQIIIMFLAMIFICNLVQFGGLSFSGAMSDSSACNYVITIGG